MVFSASEEPIQAEVTSTPRNQTRTVSGEPEVWCGKRGHTIDRRTKIGEGSLGLVRAECAWIFLCQHCAMTKILGLLLTDGVGTANTSRGGGRSIHVIIAGG